MLIVEDGTLVSGSNSYVSLADANKYLTDRAKDVTLSEGLLLQGADFVNSLRRRYRGYKLQSATSSMQFPRGRLRFDYQDFPSDKIPDVVIYAQIEAAIAFSNNQDPYRTLTNQVIRRERAEGFEREYDTRSNPSPPTYELNRVMSLLYPLLRDTEYEVTR